MLLEEVMQQLEKYGTEQNRKTYKNHGAKEPLFGVSFANLKLLKKKIKKDHDLAISLWETKNMDAMTLATYILEPKNVTSEQLNSWIRDVDYYCLMDVLMTAICTSPIAIERMDEWTKSDDEWIGRAGWSLLANIAIKNNKLDDNFFMPYLEEIKVHIHNEKNRKREAMNSALIAIGIRNEALEQQAIEIAREIGKVKIDHGATSCKTPDAEPYIKKARERAEKKKVK
ncbi:DNA alkylation repair protein [Bacillus toyonensis]|jgi:3-methyladenine DNA glycosylase AlkD|uniref:DNA alkylation repair protein n=1 Tax=Bacillus toyonensis TaxID=155322 RepID=A0AB73R0H0_9BACI|nr:DNA alkylation repair protein [Bacillus toyonensis]PEI88785.1 DNA alkylation repair protein [Bacillus toyonensis]PEK50077.1 DNA alkylation repair protein [Bacillus toyonensis]PEM41796.1 DNA alkylation repair protein [Bacillus toyonensis]PEP75928.1 DNA alkylation repair protein [Bacillus toyonensis]PHE82092.1 DNA alkylation repair protein [Bacillus toyonensis]